MHRSASCEEVSRTGLFRTSLLGGAASLRLEITTAAVAVFFTVIAAKTSDATRPVRRLG